MTASDAPPFLEYGERAVNDPARAVLDDGGFIDTLDTKVKSDKQQETKTVTVFLASGGYDKYKDDEKLELDDITSDYLWQKYKKGPAPLSGAPTKWKPQTVDFVATINASRLENDPVFSPKTPQEFFAALQSVTTTIGRIVWIGHGTPETIGLGGATMDLFELKQEENLAVIKEILPRLAKKACIDLVGCDLGSSTTLVPELAKVFKRKVRAFPKTIVWVYPFFISDQNEGEKVFFTKGDRGKICFLEDLKDLEYKEWVKQKSGIDHIFTPTSNFNTFSP
jgi:hypothetical protein